MEQGYAAQNSMPITLTTATHNGIMSNMENTLPAPRQRSPLLPPGMPEFQLSAFQGPLDLLLQLIRANRVDIADIPISEITSQYLATLAQMEELNLAVAGEYLVMAATLLEIKSRMLLPRPAAIEGADETDPREELAERLREYERFQAVLEEMRMRESYLKTLGFRNPTDLEADYPIPPPSQPLPPLLLLRALQRILSEAGVSEKPLTTVVPRKRVSLRLKMAELLHRLEKAASEGVAFEELFIMPCSRYEIVITFLALLELLRLERVSAGQQEVYGQILIAAVPGGGEA